MDITTYLKKVKPLLNCCVIYMMWLFYLHKMSTLLK